jgi:hypothetical protein
MSGEIPRTWISFLRRHRVLPTCRINLAPPCMLSQVYNWGEKPWRWRRQGCPRRSMANYTHKGRTTPPRRMFSEGCASEDADSREMSRSLLPDPLGQAAPACSGALVWPRPNMRLEAARITFRNLADQQNDFVLGSVPIGYNGGGLSRRWVASQSMDDSDGRKALLRNGYCDR